MSEQDKDSIYQQQKIIRPKIEDVIGSLLNDDKLKNALEVIAYLRENKMNPQWASGNSWKVSYRNYSVCYIRVGSGFHPSHNLEEGSWHIQPFISEYQSDSLSDKLKEIVWANQRTCPECGMCSVKISKIFGKEYSNACERSIVFKNPDSGSIECIKQLIAMRKNAIKEGKAQRHVYVAKKDR